MYLKRRYNFGYETLVKEVGDSITWRRFCRIAIDEPMPDPTTLIKARQRYGDEWVEQLNEILLQKLDEACVLKQRKLRTDTTVVESDIHHPTDATLLQDGVKVITRMVQKIRKVASQAAKGFEDRSREVKEKVLSIAKLLRRRTQESWEELNAITSEVAAVTEEVCEQATTVLDLSTSNKLRVIVGNVLVSTAGSSLASPVMIQTTMVSR
jgi:IS5 family transposase